MQYAQDAPPRSLHQTRDSRGRFDRVGEVGRLEVQTAWVLARRAHQLAVAHVDRIHAARVAVEQHASESTGCRANILGRCTAIVADRSTNAFGLRTANPLTHTCPARISATGSGSSGRRWANTFVSFYRQVLAVSIRQPAASPRLFLREGQFA